LKFQRHIAGRPRLVCRPSQRGWREALRVSWSEAYSYRQRCSQRPPCVKVSCSLIRPADRKQQQDQAHLVHGLGEVV
jgi:hypothetical protein